MKTKRAYNIVPYSTSRESRVQEALSPGYVAIDGKTIKDHLPFIAAYAEYINYYDLNNNKAGNWHPFFSHNDTVFLTLILQTDIDALHQTKKQLYDKCTSPLYQPLRQEYIKQLQLFYIELVQLLGNWFLHARKIQEDSIVYELKNAISNRLLQEVELTLIEDKDVTNAPLVKEKLYEIYKNWQQMTGRGMPVSGEDFKITGDPDRLGNACNVFLNSITYILRRASEWLEQTLNEENNHEPHIGLLLAFLQLLGDVKTQFNDLSTKHLDFYYRNLLQQREQPERPDSCVVFFELAKEAHRGVLHPETRLAAGQTEEGKEIIYLTVETEELTKAKLVEIRTLFVSTNPIIAPLNKAELVTGIYTSRKAITEKELNNENPYHFHLFGTDPFGTMETVQADTQQPAIGWAIAAPVFYMKEGKRSVSLSIRFEEKSMVKLWDDIDVMTLNSGYSKIEVLYHFFSSSFELAITGEQGWILIENYAVDFKASENATYPDEIVFLFSFGKGIESITGYNAEIHGLQYDTPFPLLQMALQSTNTYYPYTLLKDLVMEEIAIEVNCESIRDLELYDAFGKLEHNKPFEPFGPNPLKGESFYVGYEEITRKKLTSLTLDVEWYKLPQEGFENHYKAYPGDIKNDSFTFSISALSQGEWIPKKEYRQTIKLFQEENTVLSEESTYDIDTAKLYYVPEFTETDRPFSFENAENGFFKLELEDPPIGFGYEAYLKIMKNNAYENLNAKNSRKKKTYVIPEEPFVPKMQSLRMHYSAVQYLSFKPAGEDRQAAVFPFDFFHLQPFGVVKTARLKRIKERSLVPGLESRGQLFLGFEEVTPLQSLSLYFAITTRTDHIKEANTGDITWEYLLGTSWKELPKENILKDDTIGFTNSGIVKIHIPEHIAHHRPLFSGSLFWLRISAPNTLNLIRNCTYINTQAALVRQDMDAAAVKGILPAGTITTLYDGNKDVKRVFQPFPSYGGRPGETTPEFYNRVSERLYHKNRAVTTMDYERLILEKFPEIFQVSCLTSTLFPGEIKSNEIVIMILRNMELNDPSSHREFNITTLEKVKAYIGQLCPPTVKITVRNPVFEIIRVSCHIKLKDNHLIGEKLKRLQHTIDTHIAPWLYHQDRQAEYKKHILHAKGIENLIARQPYVEFVTNFSLVQFNRQSNSSYMYRDTAVGTEISPTQPWSVFVPAPSHNISLISEHIPRPATPLNIGVMQIEDDFILQPGEAPEGYKTTRVEGVEYKPRTVVLKVRF